MQRIQDTNTGRGIRYIRVGGMVGYIVSKDKEKGTISHCKPIPEHFVVSVAFLFSKQI